MKVYVSSDNVVQGDSDMNIRFRPRDGKCLERVADGNKKDIIWEGAYCNNDAYKDLGQFKIEEKDGKYLATYEGRTGGKDYTGLAMFAKGADRSEEQTSELQSLMRISYDVFCLNKKTHKKLSYKNYKK